MIAIELGMTDCPIVRELLDAGELHLDYLEVHGPYAENARAAYPDMPMVLHNSLYQWSLTHPDGLKHKEKGAITQERLKISRSPFYSLHLGFSSSDVDFVDEAMVAISSQQPRALVLERCINRLNELTALLDVPVLIENLDYNPTGAYEYVCETAFLNEVLSETDAYLLLDLAHARVTAAAFGLDVRDYLAELPMDKVRQIHLNRPGFRDGRLVDAHLHLLEEDYQLLAEILDQTQPWKMTLEYNREIDQVLPQIERLRKTSSA